MQRQIYEFNERCEGSADNKGCVELNTEIVTLPKCDSYRKNNCTGELRYTNAFYVGEISNGKEHGFGTMNWAGGDKYVGQWVNGERDGQGTYYWANGAKYVGQFKTQKVMVKEHTSTQEEIAGQVSGDWLKRQKMVLMTNLLKEKLFTIHI